ncbi:MAG: sulfatase [Candidatus Moraniibacteriota bacterium]
MNKKLLLLGGVAVLFIGYFAFQIVSKKDTISVSDQPSIIVIDICSLRKDRLGAFGSQAGLTDNLDMFAKESATFPNFWTESGWCLPNFATMLTGMRPDAHRQTLVLPNNTASASLLENLEMLPEILRARGFTTAGFSGSRYLSQEFWPADTYTKGGLLRGFDTFANPYRFSYEDNHMGSMSVEENFPRIKEWLAQKTDKSRFLYVTIDDLHSPYRMDDADAVRVEALYDGPMKNSLLSMKVMRLFNGEKQNNITADEIRAAAELKNNPKALEYVRARYDASVKRTDRLFGELVGELKASGQWDNSVVIVTAHQGESLGENGKLGHTGSGLSGEIVNVPLFIRYPGTTNGETVSALAERADIPATILDIVGVLKTHPQFGGASLLGWLGKTTPIQWKKYIFASSQRTMIPAATTQAIDERAVRNERYKLVWYGYQKNPYALYDIVADPLEQKNIISTEPSVFQELKAQLDLNAK